MNRKGKTVIIAEGKLNLSVVWAKAFLRALEPRKDLVPLVVVVNDFNNGEVCEDSKIRNLLDATLLSMGKQCCNTVANTIFPQSLWNKTRERELLYQRYKRIFPRLKKIEKKNNLGLYFERLIAYDPNENADPDSNKSNQLENIIQVYTSRKGVRRSVLQTSIFDPRRDHSPRTYLKFPCLQHVTFAPCGDGRGMAVNGFYAIQYLFERAYGNYLGLCRLGNFVAHGIGLELTQMNCTVGVGELDVSNNKIEHLIKGLKGRLKELEKN
jgi:thymidylate synthase